MSEEMVTVNMTVNGEAVTKTIPVRTHLVDFVRTELGFTGSHLGCEHGICGACSTSTSAHLRSLLRTRSVCISQNDSLTKRLCQCSTLPLPPDTAARGDLMTPSERPTASHPGICAALAKNLGMSVLLQIFRSVCLTANHSTGAG